MTREVRELERLLEYADNVGLRGREAQIAAIYYRVDRCYRMNHPEPPHLLYGHVEVQAAYHRWEEDRYKAMHTKTTEFIHTLANSRRRTT